jgi:hypothetical protein
MTGRAGMGDATPPPLLESASGLHRPLLATGGVSLVPLPEVRAVVGVRQPVGSMGALAGSVSAFGRGMTPNRLKCPFRPPQPRRRLSCDE